MNFHESWEFYKKISNGRTTYHYWLTNDKVSPKNFPKSWFYQLDIWDNNVDKANIYKDMLAKKAKLEQEIASIQASLVKLNISKPHNYLELLEKYNQIEDIYYKIGLENRKAYFSKLRNKLILRKNIPRNVEFPKVTNQMFKCLKIQEIENNNTIPKLKQQLASHQEKLSLLEDQLELNKVDNYMEILANYQQQVENVRNGIKNRDIFEKILSQT